MPDDKDLPEEDKIDLEAKIAEDSPETSSELEDIPSEIGSKLGEKSEEKKEDNLKTIDFDELDVDDL